MTQQLFALLVFDLIRMCHLDWRPVSSLNILTYTKQYLLTCYNVYLKLLYMLEKGIFKVIFVATFPKSTWLKTRYAALLNVYVYYDDKDITTLDCIFLNRHLLLLIMSLYVDIYYYLMSTYTCLLFLIIAFYSDTREMVQNNVDLSLLKLCLYKKFILLLIRFISAFIFTNLHIISCRHFILD